MTAQAAMAASNKRELKLRLQGLADIDIAKMVAFLRIGGERLQCDWKIVPDGEFHVLMLAGADTTARGVQYVPLATLRVIDAGSDRSDALGMLNVKPVATTVPAGQATATTTAASKQPRASDAHRAGRAFQQDPQQPDFVLDKSKSNLALARRKAQDVERELTI